MWSRAILMSAVVTAVWAVSGATAQTLSERDARRALFSARGGVVVVSEDLSEKDQQTMRNIAEVLADQRQPLLYYASIAYSPDEGVVSDAIQGASAHHSVRAADAAARAACNAARATGTAPCKIGMRIVPRRYEPRALTLSQPATGAMGDSYRKARAPKAMAISPTQGTFRVASGTEQAGEIALASCNGASNGANDCVLAIAD